MASELRRRDVLRASGAVALAGAAGCLDDVIGEPSEEGNDSDGKEDDGDDSTPADHNDTETAEEADDSAHDEGEPNGTDGNGIGESNDSAGSDDGDPGGANESDGTDESDEANDSNLTDESGDLNGTEDGDSENESEEGDDGDDETGGPNETEGGDGESGEDGEEGDGVDAEGTETEADDSGGGGANDSAEDDGMGEDGEGGDGNEGAGDGDGEEDEDGANEEIQSGDPPEGYVTYTNDELGYSIAHPESWEVEESGEEVYVGDPESRRELGVLTLDAAAFDSSEALAAEFLANLEADYEAVEIREEGDRSLASGQDARLLDVAYGDPESERGRRRSRLLFVTDPETDAGYVAEVAAPAEAFNDALGERAETMLESFRIESRESVERIGGLRVTSPLAVGIGS